MEQLLNPVKKNFNISLLRDEQTESTVHLWPKDVAAISPTGDISTLSKSKRNANGANFVVLIILLPKSIMKEQIAETEEDSFHHFVKRKTFRMQNSLTCYRMKILRQTSVLHSL